MDPQDIVVSAFAVVGVGLTAIGVAVYLNLRKSLSRDEKKLSEALERKSTTSHQPELIGSTEPSPAKAASAKSHEQTSLEILEKPAGSEELGSGQGDEFESSRSLGSALANTQKSFFGRLRTLFQNQDVKNHFDEIEEVLFTSDLGTQTVVRLMAKLESLGRSEKADPQALKQTLRDEMESIFSVAGIPEPNPANVTHHLNTSGNPSVWMVVGVNGAGKTTTIGKLSAHLAHGGKKVLVAAGDTFRAAAGAQLKTWTDRAQVEFFSPEGVTDPSAVAFEALQKAKAQGFDVVIVDTAGRLHTQTNLMEELKKVKRVMAKVVSEAPHETLIVLDGNSGQNAMNQAREFNQALGLTGVVLTKMDGTAKGGVAVGLAHELKVPLRLIGIGEKIGDLKAFSSKDFISSILGEEIR